MRKNQLVILFLFLFAFNSQAQLHVSAYPLDKFKVIGPPSSGPTRYESSGVGVIQKFLTKSGDGRWYITYKGTGAFYYAYRSPVNPNNNPPCCDVWESAAPGTETTGPWVGSGSASLTLTGYTCENVATVNKFYVDHTAPPGGSGLSWATAFTNLQAALDVIGNCNDEIYVAKGTYIPSKDITGSTTSWTKHTFYINKNVKIYGGYPNGGVGLRDTKLNLTSLSGNNFAENVITMRASPTLGSISNQTVIDGLTIEKGNYMSSLPTTGFFTNGAGLNMIAEGFNIICNPLINDCIFANNVAYTGGGAIYMQPTNRGACSPRIIKTKFINNIARAQGLLTGGDPSIANSGGGAVRVFERTTMIISSSLTNFSSPQFIDCDFQNNETNGQGGALNFSGISSSNPVYPVITNSIFHSNTAGYSGNTSNGGAIYNMAIGSIIENSIFVGNQSYGSGSSIYNQNSGGTFNNKIVNSTFYGNIPALGANIDNNSSTCDIKNSILWGNTSEISNVSSINPVIYSDIQGGYVGIGNINSDPLFVNTLDLDGADNIWRTPDDGLNITTGSPAINISDPAITTPPNDITGRGRIGVFDMGAYEGGCLTLPVPTVNYSIGFWPQGNINSNCLANFTITNPTSYGIEVMQKEDLLDNNLTINAGAYTTIFPTATSRSIYQLKYVDFPSCTFNYYPTAGGTSFPSVSFYKFNAGYVHTNPVGGSDIVTSTPYASVIPLPSTICAGNNLNFNVQSTSNGDAISSLNVFDGTNVTNLSSSLLPNTNALQRLNYGTLSGPKTLIFKTLTLDYQYLFTGLIIPRFEISCPVSVYTLPAPCIEPIGTVFSGAPALSNMYISIYGPSNNHIQTVDYNNGSFYLNAISGVGDYKVILHVGPTPTLTPSLPSGFSFSGDYYGGALDLGPTLGKITINLTAGSTGVLVYSRVNGANDITFDFKASAPLPVKLISFEAKAKENQVKLNWETSSEVNSAGFEIERSGNEKDFSKIGFVKSDANNGNSNEKLAYEFYDNMPLEGQNYYRLKQLDLDGKFEYSAIKSVEIETMETINVFPNPTADFVMIESFGQKIKSVELLDAKGASIYRENGNQNKIDLKDKSPGIYFLKIENMEGKYVVKKLIKN